MKYLTEGLLGEILKDMYPNEMFIHDKTVPNSQTRRRPDYRCDNLKLIIEFDGDKHYKEVSKIKSEQFKNDTYTEMGYKVVRIPYFVQLTKETIKYLFDIDFTPSYSYPHGFISDLAALPADFCELGVNKFLLDLEKFYFIKNEIIESLKLKRDKLQDIELVIPKSIERIFK